MRQDIYILRDIGILIAALLVLLLLAIGVVRLFGTIKEEKPGSVPAVTLSLESTLKSLIKESITKQERIVDAPQVNQSLSTISKLILDACDPLPYDIEILVLDSPLVNALSFPAGLIVVYSGLIERLESPEEMAAVLAHEIGHVVHRDAMKNLIRRIGLSTFFSVLGGREVEVFIRRIIREVVNMHFSRAVEARTDDFALDLLIRVDIDPNHLGKALENLKKDRDGKRPEFLKYIDSHPDIYARIQKAREKSLQSGIKGWTFDINWDEVKESLPSMF